MDRFAAAQKLQQIYGGVVVLKGAGSIITDGQDFFVCMAGNAGMATGGMGDVLTSVIAALVAQKLPLLEAAKLGVLVHSHAADYCADQQGMVGMLASDLLPFLRQLCNVR